MIQKSLLVAMKTTLHFFFVSSSVYIIQTNSKPAIRKLKRISKKITTHARNFMTCFSSHKVVKITTNTK